MNAEVRIFDTPDDVFREAADLFVRLARDAVRERGSFSVVLSGGSTPQSLYERLAMPSYRDAVAWRNVCWRWGDERTVGPDDPDSNYRLARDTLLSKVDIDPATVFRMRGEAEPPTVAAEEYEHSLQKENFLTPGAPPPRFDLVLLGMGNDGHTASLFPNTAALDERRRWVVVNDVPQLNTQRITMTYPLLNAASAVVFLVLGAAKAAVLREVLEGPHDPRRLPSQGIRPVDGQLWWYVDRAAASRLE